MIYVKIPMLRFKRSLLVILRIFSRFSNYTVDQRYEPGNEHDDAAIYADVAVCRF